MIISDVYTIQPAAGTKGRVAFSAQALSEATLCYVASASGAFFAVSSVRACPTPPPPSSNSTAFAHPTCMSRRYNRGDAAVSHSILQPRQYLYEQHQPRCFCPVPHTLCMRATLSTLFKRSDHCEDDDLNSDDSGSSSDDAADTFRAAETQLDIPDAHLGAQSTMNIHAVAPRRPQRFRTFLNSVCCFVFLICSLTRRVSQSYVVSFLPFVPPYALKAAMNQVPMPCVPCPTPSSNPSQNFSRVYPQLARTLSYTKIRRIRSLLAEVGRGVVADVGAKESVGLGLEACTVALACVVPACVCGCRWTFSARVLICFCLPLMVQAVSTTLID
jgi:hypothetical protein